MPSGLLLLLTNSSRLVCSQDRKILHKAERMLLTILPPPRPSFRLHHPAKRKSFLPARPYLPVIAVATTAGWKGRDFCTFSSTKNVVNHSGWFMSLKLIKRTQRWGSSGEWGCGRGVSVLPIPHPFWTFFGSEDRCSLLIRAYYVLVKNRATREKDVGVKTVEIETVEMKTLEKKVRRK